MAVQQMISAVASSSTPFSTPMVCLNKNGVFLSFRGDDTRKNFVSHLYEALKQKKVKTYIDDKLPKGDEISIALNNAIENSYISVIVFSENYASSKWCLGEVGKILECMKCRGQSVIPVFYNIDPCHVRKQTGSYRQAFAEHEGDPRCNKWKADLTEAANLAGFDLKNYGSESDFVKDIVRDVEKKLALRYPNQREGLVGIEENYEPIESLLKMRPSAVGILGIWGMGGIGKTTLATGLYDKLSPEFDGSCFLANVRGSDQHGLKDLHNKLFSELLENEKQSSDAPFFLSEFDKYRLGHKKVFIVLDDVDTSEQYDNLIQHKDFLGPGSRVVVTTRNKHILYQVDEIYEVKELNPNHSLEFLCLTVFGVKQPEPEYKDLSITITSYCKGNPLALKCIGASLRSRSKEVWKNELRKVQKIPNSVIHDTLKSSYSGLDCSQKDSFLDIACFFVGWDRDRVTSLLDAFDFFATSGIQVLLDKALITISDHNQLEMHGLIQQMGQEIVRQQSMKDFGRRSRLWNHDEAFYVLKNNTGTDVVEGIILDLSKLTGNLCLRSDSFAKMPNLRFLQIHGWDKNNRFNVFLPNGLESLPDKLRFLHWEGFCLESLPSNFCVEQLMELYMTHS